MEQLLERSSQQGAVREELPGGAVREEILGRSC